MLETLLPYIFPQTFVTIIFIAVHFRTEIILSIFFIKQQLQEKTNQMLLPKARQVVMTAGSPSGIAATANATAILK